MLLNLVWIIRKSAHKYNIIIYVLSSQFIGMKKIPVLISKNIKTNGHIKYYLDPKL